MFKTKLVKIGKTTVAVLPKEVSATLPSRGMVAVNATMNDHHFWAVLEPDGRGSHWFDVDSSLQNTAKVHAGDTVRIGVEPTKEWHEPNIPADMLKGLKGDPEGYAIWQSVTPMARWDWIRWVRATNNPDTRAKHVDVMLSKLKHGIRRPCCFNRSMCTDFSVAKSGVLLAPEV